MPQMANITVKASNGTTDVVFTALTPSAGDKTPAVWRAEAASTIPANRPVVNCRSQWNGNRDARRIEFSGTFPYIDANGLVAAKVPMSFQMTVPTAIPDATVSEAVAQLTNFISSSLARDSLKSGYSPA